MVLIFTEDIGTRFREGDRVSFPNGVWKHIANEVGKKLESFTRSPEQTVEAALTKPKRGRPPKKRG